MGFVTKYHETQGHVLWIIATETRLGIPIFGSNFWDPHRKWNPDPIYDSEDSGRKFFSQIDSKIRNFGPHKKSNTNSFVNTKVHGRKPSPYKTAGELFFPAKPTSTHT